ncbi:MAG TPA: nuclear transport factor 2 family protein [Candidatus Limnocylindrales bacterium]|nr:nuclear transport factor 2 family protein [Candidatus Limnocylindrales bacterium]
MADAYQRLIAVWNGGSTDALPSIVSDDYRGHMLHLPAGERDAETYAAWVHDFRKANPTTRFEVVEQTFAGDQVVSRLVATRHNPGLGPEFANGINICRVDPKGLVAEEWAIWSTWMPSGVSEVVSGE